MKKTLLASMLASSYLIAVPLYVSAAPTIYGKANVSLQSTDEAELSTANGNQVDGNKVELVSNASRIGLKGSEDVNANVKLIYLLEYQTEVDDGTNGTQTFGQRNIWLGLQSAVGTVTAGHFDTPTKVAQEKIDLFNDLEGDIAAIFKGEIRASNVVQYTSPTFGGGFSGSVAYITEENDGAQKKSSGKGAGYSASFGYTSSLFYVGVAADQDVEAEEVDLLRVIGRVNLGPVQLGVLGESYKKGNADEETGAFVSALWSINDKWAVKGQVGDSDTRWQDGKMASIGADYKMTKTLTLFSYVTAIENDEIENPPVTTPPTPKNYRDDTYVGVGMEYKF